MAKKKQFRKKQSRKEEAPSPLPPVRRLLSVQLVAALLAVPILVGITWARPRACGDFYVALAGGRDIINSRMACLTEPDTWSFVTTDRIWFDQNWGTHVLYYVTWLIDGEHAEMVLRALILTTMGFFIMMSCRQRGVYWPLAILTGAAGVAVGRSFIDMRPNLMTLMIAPGMVWLVLRTRHKPHRAWLAMALLVIWASVHGGFLFGIGVMGLWAVCYILSHAVRRGLAGAIRAYWPIPVAVAGGMVLAGLLSPYGFKNLTHALVVGTSEEWRNISEWLPIYKGTFGSTWEFYTIVSMMALLPVLSCAIYLTWPGKQRLRLKLEQVGLLVYGVLLCATLLMLAYYWEPNQKEAHFEKFQFNRKVILWVSGIVVVVGGYVGMRLLLGLGADGGGRSGSERRRYQLRPFRAEDVATMVFDLVLATVVIVMAIKARRFIPLAMILTVPLVALQVEWLFRVVRWGWLIIPASIGLILLAMFDAYKLRKLYEPDNPFFPEPTMFQRMMVFRRYPPGAAKFINANGIDGRVMHDWRWEGYLKWRCPQLKMFIGGRAQQVYDLNTFNQVRRIVTHKRHGEFTGLGIHLMVIPHEGLYKNLAQEMVYGKDAHWAYIYANAGNFILADYNDPEKRRLIQRAAAGELEYPSKEIAALSRAMCLASKVLRTSPKRVAQAFMEANRLMPDPVGYKTLWQMNKKGQMRSQFLMHYMTQEARRLAGMSTTGYAGRRTLVCRHGIATSLSELHKRMGNRKESEKWAKAAAELRAEIEAQRRQWTSGLSDELARWWRGLWGNSEGG